MLLPRSSSTFYDVRSRRGLKMAIFIRAAMEVERRTSFRLQLGCGSHDPNEIDRLSMPSDRYRPRKSPN